MKNRQFFVAIIMLLLLSVILPSAAFGASPLQELVACEQEITVQADDWLSKIAEKVYGDPFAYFAIAEATNAKHAEDSSFANIENVDNIEIGWKLCVPSPADAETLLNRPLSAPAVEISPTGEVTEVGRLVLATTTSTYDSGLLDAILPDFEAQYGAEVEVIAVGTGQAIELGENGDADVILVHARSREDAFVEEGYGVNRQDVMYNDFVIVGPPDDPAGTSGMTDVAAALTQIAESESTFVSRGDDSGTHTKEQGLWEATSVPLVETESMGGADKTFVRPDGEWYQSVGQGMGATLTVANEQLAYTLSDRATYLARKQEGLDLEILVEGDSRLFNPYGVIPVNPELHPEVNFEGAQAFTDWLISVEVQQMISEYGTEQFGMPLFVPDSEEWNAAK